ncbi:MAG: hypothetical protein AMJ62_04185 [Myxococcales bacterium SG8_38]|nr:MAG: hypothetical protein AMJ62_04185 [Myxococcales bacterium SG8_38]
MRHWAVAAALWMLIAGCGAGTRPNGAVAPKITSTPPTTATVGVPFNYTVTAKGMTPMTFSMVSGPAGLEVHPGGGMVSWTPQRVGTESIEIRVSNLAGEDMQSFEVEVVPLNGPVFTTEPPTEATVGAPYAYDPMVVANGEVSWSAPLAPEGLSIDPDTGAVRWTPNADQAGPQDVTIRATEDQSGSFTDQSFTIEVVDTGGPAVITSMAPDRVYAGELWRYQATASGAPVIEWTLQPPAMGTPAVGVQIVSEPPQGSAVTVEWDTIGAAPSEYGIALQVDNGLGTPNVQQILVTVDPRPPVPEIDLLTSPPPASVFVGSIYRYDVNLTPLSDSAGIVWSLVDAVPAGLAITIDSSSGEVVFTASESNGETQYAYTVRAQNVLGEADEETITVDAVFAPAAPVLTITPATAFTLEVGESFPGASAAATGQPAPTLSISGPLPDFLEFDPLTGLLSASTAKPAPAASDIGRYAFDIVAANDSGEDRARIEITVIGPPCRVDSITPAAGRRQSDVPVVIRGSAFLAEAAPVVRLELGAYSEALPTTFVDDTTLVAMVPADVSRPSGVYDVVVDQGSVTKLAKRFTVTEGAGMTLSGSIAANLTLRAIDSPHIVTSNVRVENGATLTLEPGSVVMFAADSSLVIDVGTSSAGALVAMGGEPGQGDQIVLTRLQEAGGPPPSGHYRGLRFGANNIAATTLLENVIVEFGGRNDNATERGAIEIASGSAPRIRKSIIRESFNYGLYAQSGAGSANLSWFDENWLTANARSPISIGSDDVSTLGANLDLLGNGEDRVFVRGSTVSRPAASWANYGVPYYVSIGLVVRGGSTMTIAAGTELRFAPNRGLRVATSAEQGALIASGTADAPIRMVPDSGTWTGVHFDALTQAGTVLRHVRATGIADNNGSLRLSSPVDPDSRVAIIESCVFRSEAPGSVGVYLAGNARVLSFESNLIDVRGMSVNASLVAFGDVLKVSNTYEAPLQVRGGSISGEDMDWSKPVASDLGTQPIRPTGNLFVSDGSLRIRAGNRIEMPLNGQLSLTDSTLTIEGTANEPVVLAPVAAAPYWNRIRLRGPGSAGVSHISYALLEAAGSDPSLDASPQRGAIVVEASEGVPATPVIRDTVIINSNGYGMTLADLTHCSGRCDHNTIVGSRFSALRISANFVGRFGTGNLLAGNDASGTLGHEGVWVAGDVIDATATWPANDVPYVVQGDIELRQSSPLDPIPVLTIEPGTEVRFAGGRRLRVGEGNDGVLDARGTVTAPITFTSIDSGGPVFWRGIDFNQGADGSTLDQVIISYGGSSAGTGNVNFRSGSIVDIGALRFTHAAHYAAVIFAGSAPMFLGPPIERLYVSNGQASNPGSGDPAFDCIRDAAAGTCTEP